MKNTPFHTRLMTLAACMLLCMFTLSCEIDDLKDFAMHDKANREKIQTYYGPAQAIGGGVMRSMVQINKEGEAVAIGMMISERSLQQLPEMTHQYVLEFHQKADITPFTHILFDWNPEGHGPLMFYGAPHFDMHLYTISNEERMMINPDEPQTEEEIASVWKYMPQDYVPTMEVVPMMGMHWVDPSSPEFNGSAFTHTFIMGSYNENLIFFEPMFTLDFLKSVTTNVSTPIKPYAHVQKPGHYYPTAYSFQYDPIRKVYIILFEGMEMR